MSVAYGNTLLTPEVRNTVATSAVQQSGLVLNIDPSASLSYSGVGSTLTDLSTAGNNATIVGSPTFNTTGTGGHLSLAGSQYLYTPDSASYNFGNSVFSIELWIRITGAFETNCTLFGQGNNTTGFAPVLIYKYGSFITFYASSTGTSWDVIDNPSMPTTPNVLGFKYSPNDWMHIGLVRYSNGWVSSFRNGVQVNTLANVGASIYNATTNLSIGYRTGTSPSPFSEYFYGDVGACRIYNQELSESQMYINYGAYRSRFK